MAGPYARAAGRSLGSTLLTLVLAPIAFALVLGLSALVAFVVPLDGTGRLIAGAITLLGTMGILALGAIAFAMHRTGVLDAPFAALGLRGRSLVPNLREYAGLHGAFAAYATYARRGGVIELALEVPTRTQANFAVLPEAGRQLRGLVGLGAPIASPDPALAGVAITGADAGWIGAFLGFPGVSAAVRTLLDDPSGREVRSVSLRPGCVKVVRRWIDPDAAGPSLARDFAALTALAEACVRLAPPAAATDEGSLERIARRHPTLLALGIVAAILAALGVPALILVAALVLAS